MGVTQKPMRRTTAVSIAARCFAARLISRITLIEFMLSRISRAIYATSLSARKLSVHTSVQHIVMRCSCASSARKCSKRVVVWNHTKASTMLNCVNPSNVNFVVKRCGVAPAWQNTWRWYIRKKIRLIVICAANSSGQSSTWFAIAQILAPPQSIPGRSSVKCAEKASPCAWRWPNIWQLTPEPVCTNVHSVSKPLDTSLIFTSIEKRLILKSGRKYKLDRSKA